MSVEQVAEATRIRQTLVRAIEHDDYRLCGGDFYARGHIRSLARTVGTRPQPADRRVRPGLRRDPTAAADGGLRVRGRVPPRAPLAGPNWSAAMAAVLVLVVVYGVAQAVTGGTGSGRKGTQADPSGPAVSNSAPAQPSASPSPTDPSAVAQAGRGRVTVQVRATGRSWLQVTTAGGKELFQGVMQAGQVKTFTDKARVKLVVGNAGAVPSPSTARRSALPAGPGRSPGCSSVRRTPLPADQPAARATLRRARRPAPFGGTPPGASPLGSM